MNANYSEALEAQLQLLRWYGKDHAPWVAWDADGDLCERLLSAGMTIPKGPIPALRSMMKFGETYYWGRDQCMLLAAGAANAPSGAVITQDMFSGQAGFYWFSSPLEVGDISGGRAVSCLSWLRSYEGVEFAAWQNWGHGAENRQCNGRCGAPNHIESDPDMYGYWPYGCHLAELTTRANPTLLKIVTGALFAGAAFTQQKILISSPEQVQRQQRKRARKLGLEAVLRVIQLRACARVGGTGTPEPGNSGWHCRWLVRGHWRQQFYPSKHANQPIWITPYVKGPDDKPLKSPRATVFAVVR